MNQFFCKNCGEESKSAYCPKCGQKQNIKLTFKYLFEVLLDSFELKKGLIFNVKMLVLNPGEAARTYIMGKTKPFLNPITFLIIALSLHMIGLSFEAESDNSLFKEIYHQTTYAIILIIAFLIPNYIIFRFKTYSFLEQVTAAVFFTSYIIIMMTILELLKLYIGYNILFDIILAGIVCYVFYTFQSILERSLLLKIIGLLASFLLAFICFSGLLTLLEPFSS